MDALGQLREQIRQAFPATPYFGPITPCDCEECRGIREGLRHKRWDELSTAFLDNTCSPVLLGPEAFAVFLPAYMMRGLDDYGSTVLELTIYSICPGDLDGEDPDHGVHRLLKRVRLMQPAQIQAVRAFLKFVEKQWDDPEWYGPYFANALEKVWRCPATSQQPS
jgi:hypothetical protein